VVQKARDGENGGDQTAVAPLFLQCKEEEDCGKDLFINTENFRGLSEK